MNKREDYRLYPGYEFLGQISMDLASDKDDQDSDFQKQLRQVHAYEIPDDMLVWEEQIPVENGKAQIEARFYRTKADRDKPLPLLFMMHGGGFVTGSYAMDNNRATRYARNGGVVAVSVNYRLAPEYPFPTPFRDCYDALHWLLDHPEKYGICPKRAAVYGSSAGGNLAAALSLYDRDRGEGRIGLQILMYPGLSGLTCTSFSAIQNWDAPVLPGKGMFQAHGVNDLYAGGADGMQNASYYAFPARCEDLRGVAPAFVVCCEYDPLRDEAIEYARRMQRFCVPVELYCLPRVPHGYDMIKDGELTKWIQQGICHALKREFGEGQVQ